MRPRGDGCSAGFDASTRVLETGCHFSVGTLRAASPRMLCIQTRRS
jgi:hypothetical protein